MKVLTVLLLVALIVLHQDSWWWEDSRLVFGFLPIGLAYHIALSIGAGVVWWLAVKYCWPRSLEEPNSPRHDEEP